MKLSVQRHDIVEAYSTTDYMYSIYDKSLEIRMTKPEFLEFAKMIIAEYVYLSDKHLV